MNQRLIVWMVLFQAVWAAGVFAADVFAADGEGVGIVEIPLYPGAAPGSENWDWTERAVTSASGMPMA